MFGNKKNKNIEDKSAEVVMHIQEQAAILEANISQMEETNKRVVADLTHVHENSGDIVSHAMLNVETESILLHSIDKLKEEQKTAYENYGKLCNSILAQLEAGTSLVEGNKHYTTPAKYISELPAQLRQKNMDYSSYLNQMSEFGKNMGVLALNSAIEAGRLGEQGKQFVAAAEEIRCNALNYEKTIAAMREEMEKSSLWIEEMEKVMHHLVALLKDSNMGATKLLKKCQETRVMMEQGMVEENKDAMTEVRDMVLGLRNMDEEIVKTGERNNIQLGDIAEEFQTLNKYLCEIESDLSYTVDLANHMGE